MIKEEFFNRELSWLEFNARVLHQGLRKELPLLERLQFLSIVTSNFDEFFQVRVASVKRELIEEKTYGDHKNENPKQVLTDISLRAHEIIKNQQDCLMNDVLPSLAEKGLVYVTPENYTHQQSDYIQSIFKSDIYPLLTPLRTDLEAFPHIKNLVTYVAFKLVPISGIKVTNQEFKGDDEKERVAFVEIPGGIDNIYWLPGDNKKTKQFALLQDIVSNCGTLLFPGFEVSESLLFKVARDADFAVDEDSGNNFIHAMEDVLRQRKSSFPVHMTCNSSSKALTSFLQEKLELTDEDVYIVERIINPDNFMELRGADKDGKLSFDRWEHFYPADLPEDEPYWDFLKSHDKILHVPYESYDPVVKFISDAADDDNVLAIKMTLYRTGRDSPIISALERAAQRGKQVIVLVELKARFDEERNIAWANQLEEAGVTVIYGLVNLKVHAKILMVIRREDDTIRRYVHLATGNYNPKTAKLYSDLSLFTSNEQIANDATLFFNLVTGYSAFQNMKLLGMAPVTMKSRILSMINREAERSTNEQPGLIVAKMNSLTHKEVISALYKASQKGVKILLNIRGICMLVPGVKGMSENIKVISIVDRYLEHSRIFYFQNGGTPELYCSSADWMNRNLDRRIELMYPILDKDCFKDVKSILYTYFKDNTNAMELQSDGTWVNVVNGEEPFQAQSELNKKYKKMDAAKKRGEQTEFSVRRK